MQTPVAADVHHAVLSMYLAVHRRSAPREIKIRTCPAFLTDAAHFCHRVYSAVTSLEQSSSSDSDESHERGCLFIDRRRLPVVVGGTDIGIGTLETGIRVNHACILKLTLS